MRSVARRWRHALADYGLRPNPPYGMVEITPASIRLRKRYLDPNERKRSERRSAAAE